MSESKKHVVGPGDPRRHTVHPEGDEHDALEIIDGPLKSFHIVPDSAGADVERLMAELANQATIIWSVTPRATLLSWSSPRFEL